MLDEEGRVEAAWRRGSVIPCTLGDGEQRLVKRHRHPQHKILTFEQPHNAGNRMRCRQIRCLLFTVVTALASPMALSETPINAPVRIIVPVGAGSISDVSARWIAEALTGILGQAIIVENKPGAGGTIAAEALKRARPDGTTLLLAPIALPVITPLVYKSAGFDPGKDLEPIAQITRFTYGLAVRADHPARTISEFALWAKANPTQASFATGAPGSIPHFLGLMFNRSAALKWSTSRTRTLRRRKRT